MRSDPRGIWVHDSIDGIGVEGSRRMTRPASIYSLRDKGLSGPNVGIYAWPGQGKTGLFADADKSLLIMDSDIYGTDTALALGADCDAAQVSGYSELEDIYQYLRNDEHPYKAVAWDSVTLFQDRTLIDEILQDAHMANPNKQSPDVPSMREYLVSQSRIGRYFRQFCELPIVFVPTFHVMAIETPDGETMWAPLLQGKDGEFATKISGYLNVLGHFYKRTEGDGDSKKVTRYLKFVGDHQHVAKDRLNAMPAVMKDPTIGKILNRIEVKRAEFQATPSPPAAKRVAKKAGALRSVPVSTK